MPAWFTIERVNPDGTYAASVLGQLNSYERVPVLSGGPAYTVGNTVPGDFLNGDPQLPFLFGAKPGTEPDPQRTIQPATSGWLRAHADDGARCYNADNGGASGQTDHAFSSPLKLYADLSEVNGGTAMDGIRLEGGDRIYLAQDGAFEAWKSDLSKRIWQDVETVAGQVQAYCAVYDGIFYGIHHHAGTLNLFARTTEDGNPGPFSVEGDLLWRAAISTSRPFFYTGPAVKQPDGTSLGGTIVIPQPTNPDQYYVAIKTSDGTPVWTSGWQTFTDNWPAFYTVAAMSSNTFLGIGSHKYTDGTHTGGLIEDLPGNSVVGSSTPATILQQVKVVDALTGLDAYTVTLESFDRTTAPQLGPPPPYSLASIPVPVVIAADLGSVPVFLALWDKHEEKNSDTCLWRYHDLLSDTYYVEDVVTVPRQVARLTLTCLIAETGARLWQADLSGYNADREFFSDGTTYQVATPPVFADDTFVYLWLRKSDATAILKVLDLLTGQPVKEIQPPFMAITGSSWIVGDTFLYGMGIEGTVSTAYAPQPCPTPPPSHEGETHLTSGFSPVGLQDDYVKPEFSFTPPYQAHLIAYRKQSAATFGATPFDVEWQKDWTIPGGHLNLNDPADATGMILAEGNLYFYEAGVQKTLRVR